MKKILSLLLLFILCSNSIGIAEDVVYTKTKTPIYIEVNNKLKKVGTEKAKVQLDLIDTNKGWALVEKSGHEAYMKTSNLEIVHIDNKTVYTKQKVKIYKKDTTKSKVLKTIPSNTKITIVSYTEKWGRLENGGFIQLKYLTEKNPEPTTPQSNKIEVADWWNSNINTLFSLNKTIKITDNKTKISWHVVRKGGTNHADVQPATAADTAKMKEACGQWSWDRRGIIVEINNKQYAASMNCMPHGGDSIPNNNFNGHFCIHFTNSRTHGSNKICSLHQAAIQSVLK